ncbi:MAG: hypothetical protein RSG92_29330, partial [Pseudomonas sp.]
LRDEAPQVLKALKAHGVSVCLLSGDRNAAVQTVAQRLGIAQAQGDCQPQDKLERMQRKSSAPLGRGERVRNLRPAKDATSERPARQPREESPARKGRSTVAERPSDMKKPLRSAPKRPGSSRSKPPQPR